MEHPDNRIGRCRRRRLACAGIIAAGAMVMGWPALRGGFVGGDDHRLVLNHVLVNHPSLTHAVQLFSIVHRDLYQPLPLLTFQAEFIVADFFGLFDEGAEGGAWLFHFDNMWLHAINALLVGAVLMALQRGRRATSARQATLPGIPSATNDRTAPLPPRCGPGDEVQVSTGDAEIGASAIACVAALLFAIHPFQVEVIGWINGRMMLLSTLFALTSMLTFDRWLERRRPTMAVLTAVLVLLSAISKIRAGVPILLFIVALAGREKLGRRFWSVWVACTLIAGVFVIVNIRSTAQADLFAGGSEHLLGSRVVRVLMALAFYFQHFVWPVGQASYYPTPPQVFWWNPETLKAVMIVVSSLAVMAWFSWRSRACLLGSMWFFAGIGDTLPFFPARNVLAADRYMYLPIIGLLWFAATVGYSGFRRWTARSSSVAPRLTLGLVGTVVVFTLIGICWRVAPAYTTPIRKTGRIAMLFPEVPRVWERLGWCYHRAGDYPRAIEYAKRELKHDNPSVKSGAYQLMGTATLKMGEVEEGLRLLNLAREVAPDDPLADYRLAVGLVELGRYGQALPHLETAVDSAPADNPTINRLARVYRRLGRLDDARRMYEQIVANNRFDVEAAIGLVELDIETGSNAAYAAAVLRLTELLEDLPDNARLLSNHGMVQYLIETPDEAIKLAARAFVALTDGRYEQAAARTDTLCDQGEYSREAQAWLLEALQRYDRQNPNTPWTYALTVRLLIADGQIDAARAFLGLFEEMCKTDVCQTKSRLLGARLPARAEPGVRSP